MSYELRFSHKEKYGALDTGIGIETTLRNGDLFINCEAKLDTGAHVCLFQRAVGESIGINITEGSALRLETLTGVLTAFGHEVVLEALGIQLLTMIYFAERVYPCDATYLGGTDGCS